MITEDFAASARRDEPKWRAHLGEKQRSNRCKGPVRAVPATKDREHFVTSRRTDGSRVALEFAVSFGATS